MTDDQVLSPRQRQICGLLAQGLAGKQIAKRIHVSSATVKQHIKDARRKVEWRFDIYLPNATALACWAVAHGEIALPENKRQGEDKRADWTNLPLFENMTQKEDTARQGNLL